MVSRRALATLLLGLGLASSVVGASDTPPTKLHFVNGHWTPWNPPASFAEGSKVYTIVRGNTLWALAKVNLGNPYLWPQLWEKNKYIEDAHWIYPGDPLLLDVTVVAPSGPTTAAGAGAAGAGAAGGPGAGGVGAAEAAGGQAAGAAGAGAPGGGAAAGAEAGAAAGAAATAAEGAAAPGEAQSAAAAGAGAAAGTEAAAGGPAAGGEQAPAEAPGGAGAATEAAGGELRNIVAPGGEHAVPVPLGTEDEIYCSGYVGAPAETFGYTVTGSEYQALAGELTVGAQGSVRGLWGTSDSVKYDLTAGDIVYLDGGSAGGLTPGALLTAIEPSHLVRHPVTREAVGRIYRYVGRVRVLSVEEKSAIAEIVQSCYGLHVGAHLKAFEPEPVPLARRTPLRPVNDPAPAASLASAPVILASLDDQISLGQDNVVYINRGEGDNVYAGDQFTIYRMSPPGSPPVVLGELAVLSVRTHTAVARIVESRYPVFVGDRLEAK